MAPARKWTPARIQELEEMYKNFIPLDDIALHFEVSKRFLHVLFSLYIDMPKHRYARFPDLYPGWEPEQKLAFLYDDVIKSVQAQDTEESRILLKRLPSQFVKRHIQTASEAI